ncbi:unnamed protein product [Rotaria sp. Silwood2]|nr:unnamed protein product [Rotaria sp. Silwood2]CAF2537369.1 unnamed protein product [Rotaria sp. Silwood2]CAF2789382.1 unnamed protein product [Rotaria sp. Silwood2]CAF2934586.1 unnamed protein product [Rotaria sp. Silwood2]CAF4581007.1 unnamed protein product [Rotaria sp. Silwood2]
MNTNQIEINSNEKTQETQLTSKEKRAIYMSQLRGSIDSEYRRIERENNARAMRKKRSENPLYREHERLQNRTHMAEIRRKNSEYRQQEHIKNRHRMASKRSLHSETSSRTNNAKKSTSTNNNNNNNNIINSIYQTLENNLQSSHISFIPYQTNFDCYQQLSNNTKQRSEYELLHQIDEYCRQHDTGSSSDSNSRSADSTPSY